MGTTSEPSSRERERQFRFPDINVLGGAGEASSLARSGVGENFVLTDPSLASPPPATRDTAETQRLLEEAGETRAEALREVADQAAQRREDARTRTLFNLAGPQVFNAITGAGADLGLEEDLRAQRKAEQRAAELERQATREAPLAELEGQIEAQRLESETEFQNQQARRQAQQDEFQATSQFAQNYNDLVSDVMETKAELGRSRGGGGGGSIGPTDQLEVLTTLNENPEIAATRAGRQLLQQTGFSSEGAARFANMALQREGTAGSPKAINERLTQIEDRFRKGPIIRDNDGRPQTALSNQPLNSLVGDEVVRGGQVGTLRKDRGGNFFVETPTGQVPLNASGDQSASEAGVEVPLRRSDVSTVDPDEAEQLQEERGRLLASLQLQAADMVRRLKEGEDVTREGVRETLEGIQFATDRNLLPQRFATRVQSQLSNALQGGQQGTGEPEQGGRGGTPGEQSPSVRQALNMARNLSGEPAASAPERDVQVGTGGGAPTTGGGQGASSGGDQPESSPSSLIEQRAESLIESGQAPQGLQQTLSDLRAAKRAERRYGVENSARISDLESTLQSEVRRLENQQGLARAAEETRERRRQQQEQDRQEMIRERQRWIRQKQALMNDEEAWRNTTNKAAIRSKMERFKQDLREMGAEIPTP